MKNKGQAQPLLLSSTGRQDYPPFSQLPYAPRKTGSDATGSSSRGSTNDSSSTLGESNNSHRQAISNHRRFSGYPERIEQSPVVHGRSLQGCSQATNETAKPKYYGAYLKFTERSSHLLLPRRFNSSRGDDLSAPISLDTPANPTRTRNSTIVGRAFSRHSFITTGQSVQLSPYSLTTPANASSQCASFVDSSRSVSSDCDLENTDESTCETGSFEDALSTMSHSYSSANGVEEGRKSIEVNSALLLASNSAWLSPASWKVPNSVAVSQMVAPRAVPINLPFPQTQRSPTLGLEQPTSEASAGLPEENDGQHDFSPRSSLVSDSFDIQIPGRYTSICEGSSVEGSTELSDTGFADSLDDDDTHTDIRGSPVTTPASFLIDVLNQWKKLPTSAEVPPDFVKQLKYALAAFDRNKLIGSDDSPTELSPSYTPSSGSFDAIGSQLSGFSGQYANSADSYCSYSYESPKPSPQWAPFSERSRIPASRQLKIDHKLIENQCARLSATPTSKMKDALTTLCPPSSFQAITTPGSASDEFRDREGRIVEVSHRRTRHMSLSFGAKGGSEDQSPKSLRQSQKKMSLAAELTRTVREGFKSLKFPVLHEKTNDDLPEMCGGWHSDWEDTDVRVPKRFSRNAAARRSSSCGPFERPQNLGYISEFSMTSPKKPYRVRFQ
ncbi:hypothetical protein PCANC_00101 [Puccinia coronata f. sp. avenae]|uniref:Uncharacterized protein n=1 Tax=Puccinia coronata f. sp. avenae TaxID=200324 RepID=A0A2N5W8K8_9BASI|nr:hypothetical protein PCASD_05465 [Puccinia coronata f. sp. avenae]PLW58581.1 hypothetical protein PCANC_00101 [Puccinia coronata f. sp. avenae]